MRKGNLFIVSGPAGVGKGTLVRRMRAAMPDVWLSVSATTRKPREGENEGEHYFFMTKEQFKEIADSGGFLEWACYSDNFYGTPRASVEQHMAAGDQVVLEIEVQGAFQVREKMPEAHMVFIEPPSLEVLEQRLRGRGTEDEATIQKRLAAAEVELSRKMEYDKRLVNDDLEVALSELMAFVNLQAENSRG